MSSPRQEIQQKVKILVLRDEDKAVSKNILAQLESLTYHLNKDDYDIEFVNAEENTIETALKISSKNADVVLIDEHITLSAWDIIHRCTDNIEKKSENKPRFYIDGEVESIVKRELVNAEFSGAVGVDQFDKNGKPQPLVRAVNGDANRLTEHTIPNTIDTKFCIGSTTKMLTAVGIVKLAEEKKLDLYKPVKDILQELDIDYAHKEIFKDFTLHELLTHTSGITGGIEEPVLKSEMIKIDGLDGYLPWIQKALEDEEIATRRGKFNYSNVGIVLLGFAIEAISGETYKNYYDYIAKNILEPADMVHTITKRTDSNPLFSISYIKKEPLPDISEVKWLDTIAKDNKNPIQEFAVLAKEWLSDTRNFNEETHLGAQDLIKAYESGLIKNQDNQSFSKFKEEFGEKIRQYYLICDKYALRINKFKELEKTLDKWIDSNEGKSGFEDAKKIREIFFQSIANNLNWPEQVLHSLIINLSMAHPAGKLYSTVDDMIAFQNALWSKDGVLNPYAKTLISSEEAKANGYGYGTSIFNANTLPGYGHFGGAGGARASCITYPDPGFTVVTCANDDNNAFHITEELDKNLVFSSYYNIQYFDPRINPLTNKSFIQDIIKLSLMRKANIPDMSFAAVTDDKQHRSETSNKPKENNAVTLSSQSIFSSSQESFKQKQVNQKDGVNITEQADQAVANSSFGKGHKPES